MELGEGPTVAERIKQGPLPFDEALPIGGSISRIGNLASSQSYDLSDGQKEKAGEGQVG
jgi:hypothetical protein